MATEVRAWWDDEEKAGYGYDWTFAPVKPRDPEYRQREAELHRLFLEHWMPYDGGWIQ